MCHPGRVDGSGLIGSPYSALEPISASRMMYTSLDACRQWQLPPLIPASHHHNPPPPPRPRAQAYVQHMQMGKDPPPLPPPPSAFMYLSSSVIYHPTNKGVQGRALACKHARAFVCAQSCVRSRSSSFAFNMQRAGGQRALLDIRSASSNSKRHQRPPRRHPPCNNEMKSTMKAGNERRLRRRIELGRARPRHSSQRRKQQQEAPRTSILQGRARHVHSEHLWRSAPPPADFTL